MTHANETSASEIPEQRKADSEATEDATADARKPPRTSRRRLTEAIAALTPAAALGLLANILQVADAISERNFQLLWIIACGTAVILPSFLAWRVHWHDDRTLVVFFWIAVTIASVGAWQLGTINATVAQRVPSALDAADALCSLIKPYDKDPQPLQVCRAFHLRDGKQVDLDDPAAESWLDATVGADVQLEAGSVRPASDDVRLYMLSGAQIEKGTYGLSYGACVKAQREQKGVDSIDLKDLDALTAICVATDEARNAILQVADYVPEDKSAVLAATCWRKPSA